MEYNLQKCQVFTPSNIVSLMLDEVGYKDNIFNKSIIDNACGNGQFLIEIVRRFIADGKKKGANELQITKQLESCIHGHDLDRNLIKECHSRLNQYLNELGMSDVNWNIKYGDGLDAFGKFDFVVGNPPYRAYKDLDKETRCNVKKNFESCSIGKFDYSYAFIEKGIKLMAPHGKMAYITPGNMFKTVFGEKIRKFIKPYLIEIIDCVDEKIFGKTLTSPVITVYDNDCLSDKVKYSKLKHLSKKNEKVVLKENLKNKWDFTEYNFNGTKRFGDYFKVSNCVATLCNSVFIHRVDETGCLSINIENGVLRPAASPKSLQRELVEKIIFPYEYDLNGIKRFTEEEMFSKFPLTMNFLNSHRKTLNARDMDVNAKWFEYGRSQALEHLNCEKLLVSSIMTKQLKIYKLGRDVIPYSGFYIIPRKGSKLSLNDAQDILQTKECISYLLSKGIKINGNSVRLSSKDFEDYKF